MKALVIDGCADKMRKAVTHLQAEFAALRTGRASSSVVEKLGVDAYGSDVPLQQLAGFGVPEPRVLTISPYDKGTIKAIEKAIQQSDLGVNPSNDGQTIRLTFPELTEDRRKDLVKVARTRAEEGRVAVRNARRHARQELEQLEKDGELGKDDLDRAEKDLRNRTPNGVAPNAGLLKHKRGELLSI